MTDDPRTDAWQREFEKRGMLAVIDDIAAGLYGDVLSPKTRAARAWLDAKKERVGLSQEMLRAKMGLADLLTTREANKIAMDAMRWSKWVVFFTGLTALATIVAAVAALTAR